MGSEHQQVLVLGAGVAGLTAALEIARCQIPVKIIEKDPFAGGHAVQLACKALDACVSCGACIVEDKLRAARSHPLIQISCNSRLTSVSGPFPLTVEIHTGPTPISGEKCSRCGKCLRVCPVPGAIRPGYSGSDPPFITDACVFRIDRSCTLCQDICPTGAVDLQQCESHRQLRADAVILATGFEPFDPIAKPYGYGRFQDVITTLELERMLRLSGAVRRPSDGALPQKMAFIQCVGSRDAKRNRLWCSRVCCGTALRQAMLLKKRNPSLKIFFHYIDIQTFGRQFESFYRELPQHLELVRSIPGDIFPSDDNRLRLLFYDDRLQEQLESICDLVVLSVGMQPSESTDWLSATFHQKPTEQGFLPRSHESQFFPGGPIFAAGSACGPMTIAETAAHAAEIAWKTVYFLRGHPDG